MDDSQSSDVFSEISADVDYNSQMDINTYKTAFSRIQKCFTNQLISVKHFNEILQDCDLCIHQCLDSIVSAIDSKLEYQVLCDHIEDAVSLLQMLSSYIKRVLESIALACSKMKTYPTITGNIILSVFSHCKDSDCLYGVYLNKVETQLKDLFRTCHELQLTYLMTLEKHLTFDLSERDELNVLLEALDINLKIGEVVQALDIKTMAEQWKAFTAVCEKYSRFLLDKLVWNKCSKILVDMIRSNMKNALEISDQDKGVLRSIKVAGFGIKILSKISNIFKNASIDYENVTDLLIYLYVLNQPYLDFIGKSIQFSKLVEANIMASLDVLLGQLIMEHDFLKFVCNIEETKLQGDAQLGYSILLINVMKKILNVTGEVHKDVKILLMKRVFWLLPKGHIWFNMGLNFQSPIQENTYCGLVEYILLHTAALAMTFNSEEFKALERIIYESLLSTDCYSGIFAGVLLVLLLRSSDQKLLPNTLLCLVNVYQKLCSKMVFHTSPQKVYLSYTIRNLFRYCSNQEKVMIFKEFNIQDRKNTDVWIALGISNLPNNIKSNAETLIFEKLSKKISGMLHDNVEFQELIKLMELAATCSSDSKKYLVLRMWDDICTKCNFDVKELCNGTFCYLSYIEALVKLTASVKECFSKEQKIEIFDKMATILKTGNSDLLYILFKLFCEFYEEKIAQSYLLRDILDKLHSNDDTQIIRYIYLCPIKNRDIITEISTMPNISTGLREFQRYQKDKNALKNQLGSVTENKFIHKCMKTKVKTLSCSSKSKSNFDLADIDSLFDYESDCEPAYKKVKLTDTEIEDLIAKLEESASNLNDVKENVLRNEHKLRISDVCVMLKNIVEK